ncbi:uncharacterized protein N7458_011799 [Penicillium daleae]|uniref:Uncharacterized protein n=1 Tax=Penicillium daleae TaxID=63821 RepID=A0AAD6FWQ5_9EURO|nr:uncharacterized protein N7458_011799 [Penicillium daleae]KAJ5432643.1 hypothetical protein N7458_011799 [Penicillium daleae]
MRYILINGLLLLAISPFTALALPVDPNDQGGQWDPSGQYRKGHYDSNGDFIPNEGSNQVGWNENGQNYQNGQYYQNGQTWQNGENAQNGNYQNGQWRGNDWNQNGQYNNRWQRRSVPSQSLNAEELRKYGNLGAPGVGLPNVGVPGVNIPGTGIHARNWPSDQNNNQGGWTDSNGQWHQGNQNNQGGWTDANGVWHQNNQNGQNTQNGAGWTDANGVWHSTDYSQGWTDANGVWHNNPNNNQGGWTDANGQWHANQKRDIVPGVYDLDHATPVIDAAAASSIIHVPRSYPNDGHYDNYREQEEADRHQEHEEDRETAEEVASALLPRIWPFNDWNSNDDYYNGRYNDKCKDNDPNDRSGWSCRSDWNRYGATPTGSVVARNYPQDQNNWKNNNGNNQNVPQATPVANYKNEVQDVDHDNKDHDDKEIKANTDEKLE